MPSFSQTIVLGHLGSDPELRYINGGTAVANVSLATNHVWKGKDGTRNERTEWHRITVWGEQAENVGKYLKRGDACQVVGHNETREWNDKSGTKRYTTSIVAERVTFLSKRDAGDHAPPREQTPPPVAPDDVPPIDDNIPF